jgi:murein DD-endopeptidase MepM/ murein hydrolase activator NlpD
MKLRAAHYFFFSFAWLLVSCAGVQSRYHRVSSGESLDSIASRYQVPVQELKKYNPETVKQGLHAGAKLYIPFEESPLWDIEDLGEPVSSPRSVASNDSAEVPATTFSWPVKGSLSSTFGPRHRKMHEGIDIAARRGTPVIAARSGHVIYATNRIRGYGKMVIIRHADTYSTVYAHLSKINVKKGQFISRGDLLGLVGRTGHATGNHLHFEVRNHRVPVDPLLYLHGQYAANKIGAR